MKALAWKLLVVTLFIGVVLWLLSAEQQQLEQSPAPQAALQVSVVTVVPAPAHISTRATGLTQARWLTEVSAAVGGRVSDFPLEIQPASFTAQGTLLLAIDDVPYQAQLASSSAQVAQAELEVARLKHEQYVAQQISQGSKLSAFGRFEPHLKAAQANLAAAQAEQRHARQQLRDTQVLSPFDAVVIEQHVTPGQWLNVGDPLYRLAASEVLDVEVELAWSAWQRIGALAVGSPAQILARDGSAWPAKVRYLSPNVDPHTRQRSVILEVAKPYQALTANSNEQPLLPGQFVTAEFLGRELSDIAYAPASALTEDGSLWTVQRGELKRESIELLDEQPQRLTFRFIQAPAEPRQVVRFPLSSMLEGQRVSISNTQAEQQAEQHQELQP